MPKIWVWCTILTLAGKKSSSSVTEVYGQLNADPKNTCWVKWSKQTTVKGHKGRGRATMKWGPAECLVCVSMCLSTQNQQGLGCPAGDGSIPEIIPHKNNFFKVKVDMDVADFVWSVMSLHLSRWITQPDGHQITGAAWSSVRKLTTAEVKVDMSWPLWRIKMQGNQLYAIYYTWSIVKLEISL